MHNLREKEHNNLYMVTFVFAESVEVDNAWPLIIKFGDI